MNDHTIHSSVDNEELYYDQLHQEKYRDQGQTFHQHCKQLSKNLSTNLQHEKKIYDAIKAHRFLPAGRVQAALGATEREVSPHNCSVSQRIDDSMDSIMAALSNAAKILRLGTGIGYNFSHLRPRGAEIKKLQTQSSGPLSFMQIFDVMASTIASSGHRRGAQMGIMNVSHPDIEAFIDAKMQAGTYRQFNLSVGITDDFMEAVAQNKTWNLVFGEKIYKEIPAKYLWQKITKNAYDSAEPGIIFIDRLNEFNNLHYCENIEATNPCSEQPLPPYGLCLLGSFNLVGYLSYGHDGKLKFNKEQYVDDIRTFVEAYDNIFDSAVFAIPEHKEEAIKKRRMGLGLTGIANCLELIVGRACYGEQEFCHILDDMCKTLTYQAYLTSSYLAKERGSFELYNSRYLDSKFIQSLPGIIQASIKQYGIRNSHLISYAPCGTISQCAGNVSSGVEPIFYHKVSRDVHMKKGKINIDLHDYAYKNFGFKGKTLEECSVEDHLAVSAIIQKYTDSAVSKTINVSSSCSYEDYATIYMKAYKMGLKGLTVFRPTELRGSVITRAKEEKPERTFENAHCSGGKCEL